MKNPIRTVVCFAAFVALAAGCQSGGSRPAEAQQAPGMAVSAPGTNDTTKVKFVTTKGDFVLEVHKSWAPRGADRFLELVKSGYYDGVPFFRAIDGFMVQFGINSDPALNSKWSEARIPDDPAAGQSNKRGYLSFATSGPDTRTTQVFINYGDNGRLDGMGFTPVAQVVSGMDVLDNLYKGYGEGAPRGAGPDQERLQKEGKAYWQASFPKLDSVKSAQVVQ